MFFYFLDKSNTISVWNNQWKSNRQRSLSRTFQFVKCTSRNRPLFKIISVPGGGMPLIYIVATSPARLQGIVFYILEYTCFRSAVSLKGQRPLVAMENTVVTEKNTLIYPFIYILKTINLWKTILFLTNPYKTLLFSFSEPGLTINVCFFTYQNKVQIVNVSGE